MHFIQLTLYAGSAKGAYDLLHGRAAVRLSVFGEGAPAKVAVLSVVRRMLSGYATVSLVDIPIGSHVHVALWALVLVQIGLSVLAWYGYRRRGVTRFVAATVAACWALLCCLSWALVFPGHMTPHLHLNPILFYLGWLPLLFLSMGLLADEIFVDRPATPYCEQSSSGGLIKGE